MKNAKENEAAFGALQSLLKALEDLPEFAGLAVHSVNAIGNFGNSPLSLYSVMGNPEAVAALVNAGAAVNHHGDGGYTPLHEAVEQGHPTVVAVLLASGADLDARNDDSLTPLQLAEALGNEQILTILKQRG